jgi:hypothetical protein
MKRIFIISSISLFAHLGWTQCTTLIFPQPGHVPVTSNQNINATGTVYWICSGLTVTILSSQGDAYICESNVTLNIVGSAGDQVFAKPGCIINNSSNADIGVIGNPSNVTLNNTGTGSLVIDAVCTPVIYDYSLIASSSACVSSAGNEENVLNEIRCYPNPFSSMVYLTGLKSDGDAVLYNVLGHEVQRWKVSNKDNKIDTHALTGGLYFLEIKTSTGDVKRSLIKE